MNVVVSAVEGASTSIAPVRGLTPGSARFFSSVHTPLDYQQDGRQEAERRVPLMISSEQEYYWTHAWQEGELEALEEINAGETHVFANPKEAIRWLLSEED